MTDQELRIVHDDPLESPAERAVRELGDVLRKMAGNKISPARILSQGAEKGHYTLSSDILVRVEEKPRHGDVITIALHEPSKDFPVKPKAYYDELREVASRLPAPGNPLILGKRMETPSHDNPEHPIVEFSVSADCADHVRALAAEWDAELKKQLSHRADWKVDRA